MEAISHAGAAVGVRTDEGVVLAAEKKILSKLLETSVASERCTSWTTTSASRWRGSTRTPTS